MPRTNSPKLTQRFNKSHMPNDERRRRAFFDKVHQYGDDKKWEARSEQILREDFLAYQRQWVQSQERSAATFSNIAEEYETEDIIKDADRQGISHKVLSQENEELEALVTMLPDQPSKGSLKVDDSAKNGSDEETYDSIFIEILKGFSDQKASQTSVPHVCTGFNVVHDEAMDVTG
ncbi:MAG: hypothetical protein Q9170_004138 [Blastenia crenularia]